MEKKVFLIGNAHIDICWLWDFEEGFQEIRATFRSAIDRIKEYGSHIFTSGSSLYFELVKQSDPNLFEEIKKAVKNGRWHIAGGWYLQPDCNAPSGESFARQGLYGQKFFKKDFNVKATTGYNVDSFGHNGNLPQILKLQEMDSYVFMRPSVYENQDAKDYIFEWEGIDGTKVLAGRVPISYATAERPGKGLEIKLKQILDLSVASKVPLMCFYGVGDHGGGPTKENIEFLRKYIATQKEPAEVSFANTRQYFDYAKSLKLNTFKNELQHHAIGCYSLRAEIKHLNCLCENELQRTERLCFMFKEFVSINTAEFFEENWKRVLFNQFHDILGGCCSAFVYDGVKNRYGRVLDSCREINCKIIQKLGSHINTSDGVMKLIVVNTMPWSVSEALDLNSIFSNIKDAHGKSIDFQIIKGEPTANFFAFRTRILLDLPPFGYATFNLYGGKPFITDDLAKELARLHVAQKSICNEFFKISFDSQKREISNIYFKNQLILNRIFPVVLNDKSDAWSHGLESYDGMRKKLRIDAIKVFTQGPLSTEYEVSYHYSKSLIKLRIRLDARKNCILIDLDAFWAEHQKMLKLVFEFANQSDSFYSEIPFGYIERKSDGKEWPCQRWIAKKSGEWHVGILNDGIYSCSSKPNCLEYGLLRSPAAAHHEPANLNENTFHKYTDQGSHRFKMMISVKNDNSEFSKIAMQFNQRPFVLTESIHTGDYPDSMQCDLNIPGAFLNTIKPAENGKDFVLRVVETTGHSHKENLRIGECSVPLSFKPFEIKSLLFNCLKGKAKEVNLLEE